jgi:3-hydroxyacyl-CoA dehydrogenase/enoyl-CoA hydratase/3-hydroxybutyryl-CoA epimerase
MNTYKHWSSQIDEANILWLYFDRADSSVNSLNEEALTEFDKILDEIAQNTQAKALIIRSKKKTGFIVGADISQFKGLTTAHEATQLIQRGQAIFNKLEDLPLTTIALIEGFCLGGGLELSLACKYRIAEDSMKTRLGLPEVKLGIHPGWGGSVRLPELVGVLNAMDVILSGRTLTAKAAKKMGIVDEAVPLRLLEKTARDYVQKPPTTKRQAWHSVLGLGFIRPVIGQFLRDKLRKKITPQHYPAPFAAVDNWVHVGTKRPEAFQMEAESIGKLIVTDTAKNLLRVFYLQEGLKAQGKGLDYKPTHVHVIGAGVMGGDIAAWCALRGFHVTLQDKAPKLIGNAIKRAADLATKQVKETHLVQEVMDRLFPDPRGEGISKADVIIEAITEKLPAKQAVFSLIESMAKPDAIFATNTSTIPLEEISVVLEKPERLVGIHFFNPVAKMPLVEIVHGKNTAPQTLDRAIAFVRKIDRLPLLVKSAPGFLVNRILLPYLLEAVTLLEEGVSPVIIDQAAVDFGMPMGPIELADTVGLDICMDALEKLAPNGSDDIPMQLKEKVAKGDLGRKTGKGFYEYKNGNVIKPKMTGKETIPADITQRLVLRLLNESVACLREGIVENADALDAGCIFGFGFPPFRGGPMTYMRTQGEEAFIKMLEEFEARYGNRFTPDRGWLLA